MITQRSFGRAPLTFTHHVILLINILYIIADSEGGFNVFFYICFIMAKRLQLSIYQCGIKSSPYNGTKWIFICIILLMELFFRQLR